MRLYRNFLKNKAQKNGLIKLNHHLIKHSNSFVDKKFNELMKIEQNHGLNIMQSLLSNDSLGNIFKESYYKKYPVLVENIVIKSSFLFEKPEFLYELNIEKYGKCYLSGYLTDDYDLEYVKSIDSIDTESNKYILKYINYGKYHKSSEFLKSVIRNSDEEKCIHLLKNFNIKLNINYDQLILENLYKNKNVKLTSIYLSTPVYSLRKMFNDNFFLESKRIINSLFFYVTTCHVNNILIFLPLFFCY